MEENIQNECKIVRVACYAFGLTNSLIKFMRWMNEVLKEFIGKFLIVYFDDISVFSMSEGENLRHLKLMLKRLQQ
jgi:hypothetical protein